VVPENKVKKQEKVKKEKEEKTAEKKGEKKKVVKEEPVEEDEDKGDASDVVTLPAAATIILLMNAATTPLMQRNGSTLGSYADKLDVRNTCLHWSSQRKDKNNRVILAIVAHCMRGGRIVVMARSGEVRDFKMIGEVSHIDEVRKNRFIVEDGDSILVERGNNTYHKCIGVSCLNAGLKSGVALGAARYPMKDMEGVKWCPFCCFQPPSARLHFKELDPEGVRVYGCSIAVPDKGDTAEVTGVASAKPAKRLRTKQAIDAERGAGSAQASAATDDAVQFIKRELDEDSMAL